MTINPDLLIAAPMLQDYLVDKDTGKPLANGLVSLYKDNARSFYKNWYYQTGIPGAYTYIPLDNPLHLSSAGTIQDPNGNDVIPFYYPFDEDDENQPEAYYITVYSVDKNGMQSTLQFTRENFPFQPSNASPLTTKPTWRNYIINNVYWRNIGSLNATTVLDQVIAPSQHDGYTNGEIRFRKNIAGAIDNLAFLPMTTVLQNDITPEYYINFTCTGVELGETLKCVQYPVSLHVDTLQNVQASIVFHGQNVAGNANNFVDLYVYQFIGTGALSQPDPILIQRVILNNTFQKFVIPFIFPNAAGLTLGEGGDDALFIQVQYPLSAICAINHTKPQIYLSTDVPDNDFDTYDQIGAIIDSPRTGDFRTSLNSFQPFGWVPANDGTIGSAASSATTRANNDTWPLYNMIWNKVLNNWAPVSSGRGANAYADFTANKTITLTRNLGRVIAGLNPAFSTPLTFTASAATDQLTFSSTVTLPQGSPIQLTAMTGSTPLAINTVYYVIPISGTNIQLATTLDNAYSSIPINITVDGSGTANPAQGAFIGESAHTMTVNELVPHTHSYIVTNAGGTFLQGGAGGQEQSSTTGSTGNGSAFNLLQPTVFQNVFLKL